MATSKPPKIFSPNTIYHYREKNCGIALEQVPIAMAGRRDPEVDSAKFSNRVRCNVIKTGKHMKDERHLLTLFPEEIWNMISQNLTSSADLENLSNASLFFREMLQHKRTLILFPKVWEIMDEIYTNLCNKKLQGLKRRNVRKFNEMKEKGSCTTCKMSRTLRDYSPVLELRLVCKSWKTGIDSYYENHPIYFQMRQDETSNFSNRELIDKHPEMWYNSFHKLTCFLEHFGISHTVDTNPFIGRTADLTFKRVRSSENQDDLISQILTKYGNQLWYCKLSLPISSRFNVSNYRYFCEWLALMPNLKVLEVEALEILEWDLELVKHLLPTKMSLHSMPTLPNLMFYRGTRTLPLICNEVIRHSPQLSMLELINSPFPEEIPDLVEQLSMRYSSLDDLPNLEWSQMNLKKLQLVIETFIEWPRIFALIDNWSDTLTDLMVTLPQPEDKANKTRIARECKSFALNLPRLKHLKIIIGSYSSLDFILPVKETLETLVVCADFNTLGWKTNKDYLQVEKDQDIQFLGYGKRLLSSNIWTLFPRLNYIKYSQTFSEKSGQRWTRYYLQDTVDVWNDNKNLSWTYTRRQWRAKNDNIQGQPMATDDRLAFLEAQVKDLKKTVKEKDLEIGSLKKQLEIYQK